MNNEAKEIMHRVKSKYFFFLRNMGIVKQWQTSTECGGGLFLKNDKEFSIIFVHFIFKKKVRLTLIFLRFGAKDSLYLYTLTFIHR